MGIRFFCPNGHKLNVKAYQANQRGLCPRCSARIIIPPTSVRVSSRLRTPGGAPPGAVARGGQIAIGVEPLAARAAQVADVLAADLAAADWRFDPAEDSVAPACGERAADAMEVTPAAEAAFAPMAAPTAPESAEEIVPILRAARTRRGKLAPTGLQRWSTVAYLLLVVLVLSGVLVAVLL